MADNRLDGPIHVGLGELSQPIWLQLSDNRFTAEIPVELGNLSGLEWLDVRRNQLTGGIPSKLGGLTDLIALLVEGNSLEPTTCIPESLHDLKYSDHANSGLQFCDEPILTKRPEARREAAASTPADTPLETRPESGGSRSGYTWDDTGR